MPRFILLNTGYVNPDHVIHFAPSEDSDTGTEIWTTGHPDPIHTDLSPTEVFALLTSDPDPTKPHPKARWLAAITHVLGQEISHLDPAVLAKIAETIVAVL